MNAFETTARRLAQAAGAQLRNAWHREKHVTYKGAVDLVTETDRQVEAFVTNELQRSFPDHRVVGEEASTSLTRAAVNEYVWYLDPLDGTTNFAHAYPQFCVSLALALGAELQLGIVYDPIREETFFAQRGIGATLNGEAIRVSTVDDLDHALLGTGFPYDRRERSHYYLGFFEDFMQRSQGIRRSGSAALDLCYVACGRLDAFWEWKLKPWDTAAGALIVAEAGGRVSDFFDKPFDLFGEQTLASNGLVHDPMCRTIVSRLSQ